MYQRTLKRQGKARQLESIRAWTTEQAETIVNLTKTTVEVGEICRIGRTCWITYETGSIGRNRAQTAIARHPLQSVMPDGAVPK